MNRDFTNPPPVRRIRDAVNDNSPAPARHLGLPSVDLGPGQRRAPVAFAVPIVRGGLHHGCRLTVLAAVSSSGKFPAATGAGFPA